VPSYFVETYVPRTRPDDARAAGRCVRAAARELTRAGEPIRYVRMTFLPGDETCFYVLVADRAEAVAEVCRRAGVASPRIVPALE
jgi:hypothetical protein